MKSSLESESPPYNNFPDFYQHTDTLSCFLPWNHDDESSNDSTESLTLSKQYSNSKQRRRVTSACMNCRKSHACCGFSRPCDRCVRMGLNCIEAPSKKRGRKKTYEYTTKSSKNPTKKLNLDKIKKHNWKSKTNSIPNCSSFSMKDSNFIQRMTSPSPSNATRVKHEGKDQNERGDQNTQPLIPTHHTTPLVDLYPQSLYSQNVGEIKGSSQDSTEDTEWKTESPPLEMGSFGQDAPLTFNEIAKQPHNTSTSVPSLESLRDPSYFKLNPSVCKPHQSGCFSKVGLILCINYPDLGIWNTFIPEKWGYSDFEMRNFVRTWHRMLHPSSQQNFENTLSSIASNTTSLGEKTFCNRFLGVDKMGAVFEFFGKCVVGVEELGKVSYVAMYIYW